MLLGHTSNAFHVLDTMTKAAWDGYRRGYLDHSLYTFLAQEREVMNQDIDAWFHANCPHDDVAYSQLAGTYRMSGEWSAC